ncbi:HalOD1 output domain-containing protein [Natronorubrum sp. FCH18a]|uniref:HalOD1 output domain-containing protein n=1 Tax=Natronorubrum sp. FCH18a TaxID=3447018 RepID=UPI003F50FF2F
MTHDDTEHHFEYLDESASVAIVQAVATLSDSDPMGLPPLEETIPCDELETLLDSGNDVTVTFSYEEMSITIHSDGQFVIRDRR